ncbi:hypothetical protein BJP40_08420 [Streptomyces sp. CC53]|uniref:hypothetical protein n=1 Tax=Streptomyces sp. CC53 TaxID=1906740 RepID=UPI0008DD2221|nr:hypothetical protein [Streptomyces sp. CC53]OII60876.1 hypothetical protein BJP40_08420 [Streptomyces sp. CC53]
MTTPPNVDPKQVRAAAEQVHAALRAWAEAVAPAVRALAEQFARLAEQLREARVVNDQGRPARPAWQSPYGPPPRRRQH